MLALTTREAEEMNRINSGDDTITDKRLTLLNSAINAGYVAITLKAKGGGQWVDAFAVTLSGQDALQRSELLRTIDRLTREMNTRTYAKDSTVPVALTDLRLLLDAARRTL